MLRDVLGSMQFWQMSTHLGNIKLCHYDHYPRICVTRHLLHFTEGARKVGSVYEIKREDFYSLYIDDSM